MIRRLPLDDPPPEPDDTGHHGVAEGGRLRDGLAIPLIRRVMPGALGAALGIGVLFSTGIAWVRDTLEAFDAQFAALVGFFGLGAVGGLAVLRRVRSPSVATVRHALIVQGVVIAAMSQAPDIVLALVGALGFGGASAAALAAGMSIVQRDLPERERVGAFAVREVAQCETSVPPASTA